MKLFDILKTVGGGIVSNFVPGGAALIATVNAVLSGDNQLPENATGHQINAALGTLSGAEKASIMKKEFDVDLKANLKAK